jgi:hypothetical protein
MSQRQTILLVEDSPVDILLMQRAFRNQIFTNTSLQIVRDGDAAVFYQEIGFKTSSSVAGFIFTGDTLASKYARILEC